MELINLKRALSESTLDAIEKDIAKFVGKEKYKLLLGQLHIGGPIIGNDEMLYSIIDLVCKYYRTNKSIVCSKTRKRPYVFYRQLIMFLCKKYTKLSLAEIGKSINGTDHATVINAQRVIEYNIKHDNRFLNQVSDIEDKILLLSKDDNNT